MTYYFVMTMTSVWNGERSKVIGISGEMSIESDVHSYPAIYSKVYNLAVQEWKKRYPGTSATGFVVDFFHAEPLIND